MASAPLPPPAPGFIAAMGRTNDAIIYGGRVQLFVSGPAEAAKKLADQLPSLKSKDYGRPFADIFAAVKGGVLAFSKSLARSVAPRVRVNVLAPGWIETSFAADLNADRRDAVAKSTPLARWGTPDDVAGAAVFLASPAAAFMTGQVLLVGGGVVM